MKIKIKNNEKNFCHFPETKPQFPKELLAILFLRCPDTPFIKEFKLQESGEIESGRVSNSMSARNYVTGIPVLFYSHSYKCVKISLLKHYLFWYTVPIFFITLVVKPSLHYSSITEYFLLNFSSYDFSTLFQSFIMYIFPTITLVITCVLNSALQLGIPPLFMYLINYLA